jgi:hypothetical protein
MWTSEVFASDDGVEPFAAFLDDLSDAAFAALDGAIQRVLLVRGIGPAGSEWLKPLGGGFHEFRVPGASFLTPEAHHAFPPSTRPSAGLALSRRGGCGSDELQCTQIRCIVRWR